MPRHIHLEPHLTNDDLEARYRRSRDPVERSHWHFLWLLARGYVSLTMCTCCSCRRIRPNCNRPSIGWPLTNTVLVNQHFASIDELEEIQAQRCVTLQSRELAHPLHHTLPLVAWWPQRLKKRQGPRQK